MTAVDLSAIRAQLGRLLSDVAFPETPEERDGAEAEIMSTVAGLLAVVERVEGLHKPVHVYEYDDVNGVWKYDADNEQILMATFCAGCTPADALEAIGDCEYDPTVYSGEVSWPCPTIKAITGEGRA